MATLRKFFDVREGELTPVALTFFYIMSVLAAYLLAKSIRNGLFLKEFGAYKLAYVYVGVPLVLSIFVPIYGRIAARFGQRTVITASLVFFCLNVLTFWYFFTFQRTPILSAIFYIWVNCFGIIAPVQVWTFSNAIFDTRQAKRLFGLVGAGASAGAILGGKLANVLVGPVGGTVNLLLVFAALIAVSAVMMNIAWVGAPRRVAGQKMGAQAAVPFAETLKLILKQRYLLMIAAIVVLTAIVTQWTQFQLGLVAERYFEKDADKLTAFYGDLNFYLGIVAFLLQIFGSGTALRKFGIAITIMLLPASLGIGSALIVLFPVFWAVLLTNVFDQSLRFSIDKATFELLYLPISDTVKTNIKSTIDIVINRVADAVGGIMLGLATQGFVMLFINLPGAHFELKGTAIINLVLIGLWMTAAVAARRGYVEVIRETIQQHRLDAEKASRTVLDKGTLELLTHKLNASDTKEILYALDLFAAQRPKTIHPAVRALLSRDAPEVRRRALTLLREAGDVSSAADAEKLLRDPDLAVRTEALLYLAQQGSVDPVARLEQLGDFEDFSIRAGMVAFLAKPGPRQNLDAARLLLDAMAAEAGDAGRRTRIEAARLLGQLPGEFDEQHVRLLRDEDPEVARHAVRAVTALGKRDFVSMALPYLGHPEIAQDAADAIASVGDRVVGALRDYLFNEKAPLEVRRAIPAVLLRIGTPAAQQVLAESLLEPDPELRYRVISSLNKLSRRQPDLKIDPQILETVLAAEIMGHYRSYQILGALGGELEGADPVLQGVRESMRQESERIFRLMSLMFPTQDIHSAYVGLQAQNPTVTANALEFLDNVLKPEIRMLVVPLFDRQVTVEDRITLAQRFVGADVTSREDAVATLALTGDPWLRSCAAYAIGALGLKTMSADLEKWKDDPDPLLRETARHALQRLSSDGAEPPPPPPTREAEKPWHDQGERIGVG